MLDIYQTLEIKQILQEVASYSRSELAKQRITNLKMYSTFEEVKHSLAILDEMLSCSLRHGRLPINVSFDISRYIETALKGGVLTPLDLDHVANDILVSQSLFSYFSKVEKALYPLLLDEANKMVDLDFLEKEIHRVITPNLSIFDNASPELNKLRRQIANLEGSNRSVCLSLLNKYKDFLSEASVTIRNDHFVLPVKSADKNKVPGVIHDISDSGQTTFIEPNVLVDLSNQLYLLRKSEKEEIYRILRELSLKVVESSKEMMANNKVIAELDFVDSKANYGNIHDCLVASLSSDPLVDIKGARHPLIEKDKVVANDFLLNEKQRLIIISGPNAGGKTVALKTLGLMVMMNQMGLALPTKSQASLSFFPKIYADIGDNQSLSDNLSTFAAHVSNLSTITYFVTSKDLVLLDELGTGTSPAEGEAIALAVSDFLLEKKCFGVISSHFEEMKEYAFRRENVSNAMMVFDEKQLLPTYVLRIGYPGRSYGLEMAKRYRLKDSVIVKAQENLGKSKKRSVNDVLDKLNAVLRQNEEMKADLLKREKLLSSKEKDVNYQSKTIEKKKATLLEDVEDEKQKLIDDAKEEINKILRVIADPNSKQKDLISAKKALEILENQSSNKVLEEEVEVISLGDYVDINDLDLVGKVVSIKGSNVQVITTDGMSINTKLNSLKKTSAPMERRVMPTNVDEMVRLKTDVKLELNLIGEHVDDGIHILEKYLDDARVKHFSQVRIIHGMGTGALRKAIHEYLAKCDFVKEYHYGGQFDGGTGATIVVFK